MKKSIKKILEERGVYPSKKLGQNFLISEKILHEIIKTSNVKENDTILEVGPGLGMLTKELAIRAKRVIGVEKDKRLVEFLKEKFSNNKKINIKEGDILNFDEKNIANNYKLIANLPYSVATEVIRKFLESKNPPSLFVIMIQKEVGERICASPPNMSKLSVFSNSYGLPEITTSVPRSAFWPQPKVTSVIVKIIPEKKVPDGLEEKFEKLVKAGFSHPRKQLLKNLYRGMGIEKEKAKKWIEGSGIDPTRRAETLNVKEWIILLENYPN